MEWWVGCASRLDEREDKMWLPLIRGDALEVQLVGVGRRQYNAHVTLCLHALPLADSTWYVN
jgi:hypothetical protein